MFVARYNSEKKEQKMNRIFTIIAATLVLGLAAGAAQAGEKVKIGTEGAYPPFKPLFEISRLAPLRATNLAGVL